MIKFHPKERLTQMKDRLFSNSSLRCRLMIFLCVACGAVLLLVWLVTTQLIQPLYNYRIKTQLTRQAATLVQMIEQSDEPISTQLFALAAPQPNGSFWKKVNEAAQQGKLDFSEVCIDVADANHRYVNGVDTLHPCLLHPDESGTIPFSNQEQKSTNGDAITALRIWTAKEGRIVTTIGATGATVQQMVVGMVAHNPEYGDYTVIFSTSLARIQEAGQVLYQMMPLIFLILMIGSAVASWLFSNWFTRPLTQLSLAARRMAEGDYSTRVQVNQEDELGRLAEDFNYMASEVGRTAQLQRDLIANVSHDLRTPLTLIRGYAETVRDLTGDDAQKRTQQLDIIVDETNRLSSLVNSVMELSKVSSGTDKPNRIEFDMSQLCEEVAQRYQAVCQRQGCKLELELDDQPHLVYADPAMMERVLHNLLGNALQHLGEDNLFILRLRKQDDRLRVEVEDHGPGIAKEELPSLFDRYYRSRKDQGKPGTGLGLSITKAILQSHGFHFGVNSTLGKGSCFWFELDEVKSKE